MASPEGAARDDVTQALQRASVKDRNDNRNRFIPREELFHIINKQKVRMLLEIFLGQTRNDDALLQQLACYISPEQGEICHCQNRQCTGARIIFAALLMMAREELIVYFFGSTTSRICDKDLPLYKTGSASTISPSLPPELKNLGTVEKELFCHLQWQMRSPYLRRLGSPSKPEDANPVEVEDEVALPWTDVDENTNLKDGDLSYVRKIKIHSHHHDLGPKDAEFALKVFKERHVAGLTEDKFKDEIKANLNSPIHDRVVRLLAALKHKKTFYLLFPWAHYGSLLNIWTNYSAFEEEASGKIFATWYSTDWLLSECLGIADGLATIHGLPREPSSITHSALVVQLHADIKPENILGFESSSRDTVSPTLMLADLGEAKTVRSNSKRLERLRVAHTKTYRPPEHDIETHVSLKYDVWCLGCLFLDFITWVILGSSGVEAFGEARAQEEDDSEIKKAWDWTEDTFFKKVARQRRWFDKPRIRMDRDVEKTKSQKEVVKWYSFSVGSIVEVDCRVKTTVISQINDLRKHQRCNSKLGQILSFVEERMLVTNSEDRADSSEVRRFLQGLKEQVETPGNIL